MSLHHQYKYPEDFEEDGVDERALELEDEEDLFEKIEDAETSGEFGEVIKGGEGTHTQDWIQVLLLSFNANTHFVKFIRSLSPCLRESTIR